MTPDDRENLGENVEEGRPAQVGEPLVVSEDTAGASDALAATSGPPPEAVIQAETPTGAAPVRPTVETAPARRDVAPPVAAPSTFSWTTALASALLALICGGAGAWGYHTFLAGHDRSAAEQGAGGNPAAAQVPPSADVEGMRKDLNQLGGRVENLQERLNAMNNAAPPPDLEPIRTKVAQIDDLSSRIDDLDKRFGPLGDKVDQNRDRITNLQNQVKDQAAEAVVSNDGADQPAGGGDQPSTEVTRDAARPATGGDSGGTGESSLDRGIELFRKGDYKDALNVFRQRTEADPDDARNWYLAALANGFATGNWRGETEQMVKQGIDREKAGQPATSTIDSTINFLTAATGKDWLSAYRKRAH